jgi:hypothetical protein
MGALQIPSRDVNLTLIGKIDQLISSMPHVDAPAELVRTPGLWTRKITMPAGSCHRSKIHQTEHQFCVLSGSAFVRENGGDPVLMLAPHNGVTKPGTWRELFIIQPMVWITSHPSNAETAEELEKELIFNPEEKA